MLLQATIGRPAMIEISATSAVKAPLMVPGRKKASADPDHPAREAATLVPAKPAIAKRVGLLRSNRVTVMATPDATAKTDAVVSPAAALKVMKTIGGMMASATGVDPTSTLRNSSMISFREGMNTTNTWPIGLLDHADEHGSPGGR
jgi:hypothetical protein